MHSRRWWKAQRKFRFTPRLCGNPWCHAHYLWYFGVGTTSTTASLHAGSRTGYHGEFFYECNSCRGGCHCSAKTRQICVFCDRICLDLTRFLAFCLRPNTCPFPSKTATPVLPWLSLTTSTSSRICSRMGRTMMKMAASHSQSTNSLLQGHYGRWMMVSARSV